MKKLTLDQTWSRCLAMWRWIGRQVKAGSSGVGLLSLKQMWLCDNHADEHPMNDCYFCEWARSHSFEPATNRKAKCSACPAAAVDPKFYCMSEAYDYLDRPAAFLRKLEELNAKRLAAKKAAKTKKRGKR